MRSVCQARLRNPVQIRPARWKCNRVIAAKPLELATMFRRPIGRRAVTQITRCAAFDDWLGFLEGVEDAFGDLCRGQEPNNSFKVLSINLTSSGLVPGPPAKWPQIDGTGKNFAFGMLATSN
jgi:hypothetical protein